MLYRYAGSPAPGASAADLSRYSDAGAVAEYARDAVRWAAGYSLLSGGKSSVLDPEGRLTRYQAAKMIMNYISVCVK